MEIWILLLLFICYQIYKLFFSSGVSYAKEKQKDPSSPGAAKTVYDSTDKPFFEAKKTGLFSSFEVNGDLARHMSSLKKKPISQPSSSTVSKSEVTRQAPTGWSDPFIIFRNAPRRDRLHKDDDLTKINLFEVRGGLFR